jgi:xanthine dehydrogenase small subunit
MSHTPLRQHTIRINGENIPVRDVPPQATLLDFLRGHGLTGAKEGCAEGECGACTVAMVSGNGSGSQYKAVNSCLMFVADAVDREFVTVEALAEGDRLAEAQQAMAANGSSQCGYCTPGFVMSLFAEQYRSGRTGPCDLHALAGNLCRCTGYRPIREAAESLGPAPQDRFSQRLREPAPALRPLLYLHSGARFERPATLPECLSVFSRHPSARLVAGATDLAVESSLRFSRWSHLISLEAIALLRQFEENDERIRIGGALPLSEIGAQWTTAPPAVGVWLELFASPPIRNRATLGGNLATASPIGDSAPLLLALDASLVLASIEGSRTVPLAEFFTGYRKTELRRGEMIRAIEVPRPYPGFTRFYKAAKRRFDDISTVAAALSMDLDANRRVRRALFAFGGVAPTPLRAREAEDAAMGRAWNEDTLAAVCWELERALAPIDDHRGSAAYRKAMAQSLVAKFYFEWKERAE